MTENDVMTETGERVNIRGRWLYVKKCLRKEEMGGIILSEKSRSDTVSCLVLAVGDGCGKYYKLSKHEKKIGMMPQVEMTAKPLDKVLLPDGHEWGVKPSPYAGDEHFVHECIIKAIIEE